MEDLLTREQDANRGVAKSGIDLGINIMGMTQPNTARALATNLGNNPLMGGTQPLTPNVQPTVPIQPPVTTTTPKATPFKAPLRS